MLLRQQQELTEQQQVHWASLPLVDVVTKMFLQCQKALRDANVALHKDKEEMLAQLQTGQSEVMSILFFSQISLLWTTIAARHRAIWQNSLGIHEGRTFERRIGREIAEAFDAGTGERRVQTAINFCLQPVHARQERQNEAVMRNRQRVQVVLLFFLSLNIHNVVVCSRHTNVRRADRSHTRL